MSELAYRDFYYPLNVFMHILTHEEGGVRYLHYGLFEEPDDAIAVAQEHSTEMLFARLPPVPASILEVGAGLGTTLDRLTRTGYRALGITPDVKQVAAIRDRYAHKVNVRAERLESFQPEQEYDCVVFQESAQYIDSESLFAKCRELTSYVIVLDEFALETPVPGALHTRDRFLSCAAASGFRVSEEVDLSAKAVPTVDYFTCRLPHYRDRLVADLGVSSQQVDDLIESGRQYAERYRSGAYGYRLFTFHR
jgi:hypothetical protein